MEFPLEGLKSADMILDSAVQVSTAECCQFAITIGNRKVASLKKTTKSAQFFGVGKPVDGIAQESG